MCMTTRTLSVGDHLWVEPPNTEWGATVHLIDLRGAADVGDTVQCNCASYAARTPGKDDNRRQLTRTTVIVSSPLTSSIKSSE